MTEETIFERAGGADAFIELVDRFYERVEQDDVLRAVYPDDLEPGKTHLAKFLMQYWGAGQVYSEERGHPRLRMRHATFTVTPDGARRWMTHMLGAIRSMDFDPDVEQALTEYVVRFAPAMVNQPDEDLEGGLPQV